jgi:hypothetical protein
LLSMKDDFGLKPLDVLWNLHTSMDPMDNSESFPCILHVIRMASHGSQDNVTTAYSLQSVHDDDACSLLQACFKLGLDIVPLPLIQSLICDHPQVVPFTDSLGRTFLHLACIMKQPIHMNSDSKSLAGEEIIYADHSFDIDLRSRDSMDEKREFVEVSTFDMDIPELALHQLESFVILKTILEIYPQAATMSDVLGYLPLHYASENGVSWGAGGTKDLVLAYPEALSVAVPSCELYPFMFAASAGNLELTYHLLRNSPHQIKLFQNDKPKKVVQQLPIEYSPVGEQGHEIPSRLCTYSPTTVTVDVFALCFYDQCMDKDIHKSSLLKKRKRSRHFL